jgi:acetyltransferase-like isoleucine patch superfamily enzyme
MPHNKIHMSICRINNIGENAEIGACSQVRHDAPDNEVWHGNPAHFLKIEIHKKI